MKLGWLFLLPPITLQPESFADNWDIPYMVCLYTQKGLGLIVLFCIRPVLITKIFRIKIPNTLYFGPFQVTHAWHYATGGQVVRKSLNSSTEVVVVTCSGEETHLSECEDLSRSMSDTAISITCQQKCMYILIVLIVFYLMYHLFPLYCRSLVQRYD